MIRIFTKFFLSTLVGLAYLPLHAQPVTTEVSIVFGEVVSEYSFSKRDEPRLPLGPDGVYDFAFCGDEIFEYRVGEKYFSAPAKDVPAEAIPALKMFAIDEAFRASFGEPLPDRVIGLNRLPPPDQGVFEYNDILKVKPSGLYYVAYQSVPRNSGEVIGYTDVAESENIYIPFGLRYGEQFDTVGYHFQPDRFGNLDSISRHTTIEYLGYGTFLTWKGDAEEVATLLYTVNETLFLPGSRPGEYHEDDSFETTYLYLLSAKNAIPRAIIRGTYDQDGGTTFSPESIRLYLPTSMATATTTTTGIPGGQIDIFPNPTGGAFSIDLTLDRSSFLDVEAYAPTGQLIYRRMGLSGAPGRNRIPLSGDVLPPGLYFVRLNLADGSNETRRVIVK